MRDDILDNDIELDLEDEYTDEVDTDEESDQDEATDDVEKLKAEAAKWKAIAQRNRKKVSTPKDDKPKPINQTNQNPISRDEAILFAQGYTEEDVDQLSLLAKGAGISLKEAKEHPLFQAYKEKVDGERRAKKATMGASKGSTTAKQVDVSSMTPEEHQELWLKKVGVK